MQLSASMLDRSRFFSIKGSRNALPLDIIMLSSRPTVELTV
jgi:hypothetical protein